MNYLKRIPEVNLGTWTETEPDTFTNGLVRVKKVECGWIGVALNEDGSPCYGHFYPSFKQLLKSLSIR